MEQTRSSAADSRSTTQIPTKFTGPPLHFLNSQPNTGASSHFQLPYALVLYWLLLAYIRATCPAHPILFRTRTLPLAPDGQWKSCSFLQPRVSWSLLNPSTALIFSSNHS